MAVDLKMASILKDPGTRVVICCGAGGVGKTTTAAAMAMYAAEQGRRVAVLTIDPARRLAQSLGMTALTNEPQPVQLNCAGSLDAMMLDMRRTFDDMVIEHSTPERAAAILENSFYQTMASSFSGTQEYMAMEKLGKLLSENRWDLIVVDTPPSRNALDFLDAPKRLGSFLSGRLMKMLVGGGRGVGRMVTGAMSLAMRGVSTIIGGDMLRDVATFVQSLDSMFGGFQERALKTYELLKQPGTRFVVVAAAEADALREAAFFVDRLSEESMPLAGLILNRTHPNLTSVTDSSVQVALDRVADELTRGVLTIHADRATTAQHRQPAGRRGHHARAGTVRASHTTAASAYNAVILGPTRAHERTDPRRTAGLRAARHRLDHGWRLSAVPPGRLERTAKQPAPGTPARRQRARAQCGQDTGRKGHGGCAEEQQRHRYHHEPAPHPRRVRIGDESLSGDGEEEALRAFERAEATGFTRAILPIRRTHGDHVKWRREWDSNPR